MKPVIQLARKPDGLPVVMLIDGPEGPPVSADELAILLRVAYMKLGKPTVNRAIAATWEGLGYVDMSRSRNKAWARLLAAERAHHDHTLLLSDAERDDDMKGPRAAVVEAEESLLALGVDPEDPESLRGQLDRQDDREAAADRNHPLDAEFPNDAAGGAAGSSHPAFSSDERCMALRCVTWLEAHAVDIEAKVDDECDGCDGCDADAFCAQAETIREAAREMAKAFSVEMPR